MSAARALALLLGLSLVSSLAMATGLWVWLKSAFPPPQGGRIRAPHDVVGVWTDPSFAWVVPTRNGVVLIDTGVDPIGQAIAEAIGDKVVQAVLLTHAHPDHIGGLDALPATVPVYASAEELDVLAGRQQHRAMVARWLTSLRPPVRWAGPTVVVKDGEVLHIDGVRFLAKQVPGHTAGSVAYLWEEILFTGDAVLGGPGLAKPPEAMSDDPRQATASLARLAGLDFDVVADGHVGLTTTARPALLRMAGVDRAPPAISMRSGGTAAAVPVEREGIYVSWPVADVRGQSPALVLLDDGTEWRLADAPFPDHVPYVGKRVVVTARLKAPGAGPGLPVQFESVKLAADQPAAERPLPQRIGEIVPVDGAVKELSPLTAGAAWGEGEIALSNGIRAEISAPLTRWVDGRIHGFARVTASAGERVRLVLLPAALEAPPPAEAP